MSLQRLIGWLKKDFNQDRERFNRNPVDFIMGLLSAFTGTQSLITSVYVHKVLSSLVCVALGTTLIILAFYIHSTIKEE